MPLGGRRRAQPRDPRRSDVVACRADAVRRGDERRSASADGLRWPLPPQPASRAIATSNGDDESASQRPDYTIGAVKAILIHEDGGPEVLLYEDVPDPEPGPGEVLVRMRFASLNHLDVWTRKGLPSVPKPRILGADGSGVVEALGRRRRGPRARASAVVINPGLEHGDAIHVIGEHTQGVHAELAAIPATNVVPLRDGVSFEEAAAFPLVYETAYRMLVTRAQLQAGEWVLVWGIGGGVATRGVPDRAGARRAHDRHLLERREAGEGGRARRRRRRQPRVRRRRRRGQGGDRQGRRRRRRDRRRGDVEALARRGARRRPRGRLRRDLGPEPAGGAPPALVEAARPARLDDGHARRLRGRLRPRRRRREAGDRQGVPARRGACRARAARGRRAVREDPALADRRADSASRSRE